jgi:hypothetical protein
MGRIGVLIASTLIALAGLLVVPGVSQAEGASSCNHDPCTKLPYSFNVAINGQVVPNMDDNVFGTYNPVVGTLLTTNPETYVTNPDGTITGTVTADVIVGLSVSQSLANDVTVYFEGGMPQDGLPCPDGPCTIPSFPCTLGAGLTSTSCDFPDWWQSYSSTLSLDNDTAYNVIYTDPGQPNLVDYNGHPNSYGYGFAWLTAFIPTAPTTGLAERAASSRSFTVRYRPTFAGNFTLNVKRGTRLIAQRFLGWKKAGAYSVRFWCGTRTGNLTLVVVGTRHGNVQRSNPKSVTC